MRLYWFALLFLALAFPAQAQTPAQAPQQSTVQQIISMHANVEAQLAEQLDQARAQIQKLTAEIAELKKAAEKKPDANPK